MVGRGAALRLSSGPNLKRIDVAHFNAQAYWEDRLACDYTLGGVGRLTWGQPFNRWAYRVRRRVFLRLIREQLASFSELVVLDIGSGTGFYIDLWRELGALSITGCDITDFAVGRLRQLFPSHTFHRVDIGAESEPLPRGCFDVVSCCDVLFHIVDDARYVRAFQNIYSLLKPGGVLVFTEVFRHEETLRHQHIVHRSIGAIDAALDEAGFETVVRRPLFVLMNDAVDSRSRILKCCWWCMRHIIPRMKWMGVVAGAALYPLELALVRICVESPTTEIMIARKPMGAASPVAVRQA